MAKPAGQNSADAQALAQAIIDTIPEPFLVLNPQFQVLEANRCFYETFGVAPEETKGTALAALGDGQWDIPALREQLETIIPDHGAIDNFEVNHDFPGIGKRIMVLNARRVREDSSAAQILLVFRDVTASRAVQREKEDLLERTEKLLRQKEILLREMQHRVANSLQIIASILMLKASALASPEAREHLRDAHNRVMSVAAVQNHLHAVEGIDRVDAGEYFSKLCDSLAASMVDEDRPVEIKVVTDKGTIDSSTAVSLGLMVTELAINALKYAFPATRTDALILVTYEIEDADWKLVVSDNGVGMNSEIPVGLGTSIVEALAKQLGADVEVTSEASGMRVAVTRATFASRMRPANEPADER